MDVYVLLLVSFVAAGALASDVLDLNEGTFDGELADVDIALVEFYAPWCGHCKKLAPEYEKAATKLKANDPPVTLAKVDCTTEKPVCDKYDVSGFPSLKIFRKGAVTSDYEGPREADGIVKYMRGQSGPSSKELKNLKEFDKFIDNEEHSIVGFFKEESKLKDSYLKVADTERDRYRFAHTSNEKILAKVGYTDDIVIYQPKRLHNKFEDSETRYDGNYDTDKIKKFCETEMQGLVGHRTQGNQFQFEARPLVIVYYNVDYVKDLKGTNYWRNRVLKVAKEFKKFTFSISNRNEYHQEVQEFGLGDRDAKTPVVAIHGKDGEKFPMNEEFSVDNLKAFVESVASGSVEAHLKSEPVPENQDAPVKVVVAKNFKKIVDQDKDVLIEFYAPWCGHCKTLAPKYDELAEKLKTEDGVVIAKMDATANDVPPRFAVQGFPTLYWAPKGQKATPVPYNGGREVDDFIKFIAKHATEPLKGYDRNGNKKQKKKKGDKEL